MRHSRLGPPKAVLHKAIELIAWTGCEVVAVSPFIASRPLGPSRRAYVNAAAVIDTEFPPLAMLNMLHGVELLCGRRRLGQPWGARTLDLDLVLWSGGEWDEGGVTIPHPRFRERAFVLGPATAIAPGWRDPDSGLTLRQLQARLTRPQALPRDRTRSDP